MTGPVQSRLQNFSEPVAEVLNRYGNSPLPLTRSGFRNIEDCRRFREIPSQQLFPGARSPKEALSGLLLLIGSWDESHQVAQDLTSIEGQYWHVIAHRIEPDPGNAAYWFRQTGQHPIFPALHACAAEILEKAETKPWHLGSSIWNPLQFIDWCSEARQRPGSVQEQIALSIQQAEWEMLFDFCAARGHTR